MPQGMPSWANNGELYYEQDGYLLIPDRHNIIHRERESDRDVIIGIIPSLRLLRKHFTLGNLVRRRQSFAEKNR